MRNLTCAFCFFFITYAGFCQRLDTLNVYFPIDKTELSENATKFIDSLVNSKVLERGKKVSLLGYGDYLGNAEYNKNLSYARAKNIQDYMVLSGFSKQDVVLCAGMGRISKPPTNNKLGVPTDRKVQLIFEGKIDTPAEEKFNYYLLRLQEKETYTLSNVRFYQGSLRITPGSVDELKMLYRFLVKNSTIKIQLEGHVCCLGRIEGRDEPYDESTLSQKRAESIADSMFVYGIEKSRIKCVGLGNNNPIVDPETYLEIPELSRRVDVKILSR